MRESKYTMPFGFSPSKVYSVHNPCHLDNPKFGFCNKHKPGYTGTNVLKRKGKIMPILILLRHGESQWNLENRFTGWVDVPLSPRGEQEARIAGEHLKNLPIDTVYTSVLQRAVNTARIVLETVGKPDLPAQSNQALNERHYGDLQGLNKAETAAQYGEDQVKIWRRSFDIPPPGAQGESLKDTAARTLPYFDAHILPDIKAGKNVLVVAHGNSLRSIVMSLDNLSPTEVIALNIPTGVPLVYTLDDDGKVEEKRYLFTRDDAPAH